MREKNNSIVTIVQLSQLSFFGNKNHKILLMKKRKLIDKEFNDGRIPDIFIKGICENRDKLRRNTEKRINNFFRIRFKIRNREDLLKVYDELLSRGRDTADYWVMYQSIKLMCESNIGEILAADKYDFTKKYLMKNLDSIKNRFRAYDFANAVSILRLGFFYGYLDKAETIDMLLQVYEEASRIYDSSEQFAVECCLAYEIERFIIKRNEINLITEKRSYLIRETLYSRYTGELKRGD